MGFTEPKNPEIWIIADQSIKNGSHTVGGYLVERAFDVRYFLNHDDAWEAKNKATTRKPAAILCDGDSLVGITGEEYIRQMKMSNWKDVPIAAFSSMDAINVALKNAGANHTLNRTALAKDIEDKAKDRDTYVNVEYGAELQRLDMLCSFLNQRHRNPISFA